MRTVSVGSLVRRLLVFGLGLALVASAVILTFYVMPEAFSARTEESLTVRETASTWTPEAGWREEVRRTSVDMVESGEGFVVEERVSNAASPRGSVFEVPVFEDLRLVEEPRARMGFPAVGFFQAPMETVHLAVPWEAEGSDTVHLYDRFDRVGVDERGGVSLVEYNARHGSQALLHDGEIWFRQVDRTVWVEPVTGMVVDYVEEEALWSEPYRGGDPLLGSVLQDLEGGKEKRWEATVAPTPAASSSLLESAKEERMMLALESGGWSVPVFVIGQALMFSGLVRWPRVAFPEAA